MKQLVVIFSFLLFITGGCISIVKGPKVALQEAEKHHIIFDAVVVPGSPFSDGKWDSLMKGRVIWAWILYKNGITKNIIFSGGAVYSPYYESKIMGLYAQKLGVPKEHILYDTMARHSTENIYYSYLIAKQKGFKVIAIATDPVQSGLLKQYTNTRFETIPYHLPIIFDSVRKYDGLSPEIDPRLAEKREFTAITDEESTLRRFLGTIGSDIKWKEHKGRRLPAL